MKNLYNIKEYIVLASCAQVNEQLIDSKREALYHSLESVLSYFIASALSYTEWRKEHLQEIKL